MRSITAVFCAASSAVSAQVPPSSAYVSVDPLFERPRVSESVGILTNAVPGGALGASASGTLANVNIRRIDTYGGSATLGFVLPSRWSVLGSEKSVWNCLAVTLAATRPVRLQTPFQA